MPADSKTQEKQAAKIAAQRRKQLDPILKKLASTNELTVENLAYALDPDSLNWMLQTSALLMPNAIIRQGTPIPGYELPGSAYAAGWFNPQLPFYEGRSIPEGLRTLEDLVMQYNFNPPQGDTMPSANLMLDFFGPQAKTRAPDIANLPQIAQLYNALLQNQQRISQQFEQNQNLRQALPQYP